MTAVALLFAVIAVYLFLALVISGRRNAQLAAQVEMLTAQVEMLVAYCAKLDEFEAQLTAAIRVMAERN